MPIQNINTGSSANAGNGDSIRLAFDKVNRNFSFVQSNLDTLSAGNFTSLRVTTTSTLNNLTVTGTTYLNSVESASFYNNTYFENIVVSDKSTLNHVTATDVTVTGNAKIDTLDVLTSLSVGSYQIAAINDYDDFSIIKNDATGLAVVLLNTNADSNSKLVVKDNISGGLAILHQNVTNLAGDFVAGENYIYGETPTDVIHIGAYSDIKLSASQAKYYDPSLPETPSMVVQSIDGAVHIYSSATFHSDVYGITGVGTLDRLTSQDLSKVVTLNNNGSLVPSANLTYDLGSTSSQWRSLYVGTSTIYLGGTALSVAGGNITIDGEPIQAGGSVSSLTNGTYTVGLGADGRLVNLDGLTLTAGGQFNICTIVNAGSGYNTGSALKATTGGSGTGMTVGIGYGLSNQLANVTVVNPGTGYVDGDVITVSEGTDGTFIITQYNELGNQGNNNFVQSNWTFGADGILTLPSGNTRIGDVFGVGNDVILGSTDTSIGIFVQGTSLSAYGALQWVDDIGNIGETGTHVAAVVVNAPFASSAGTVQIATGAINGLQPENIWEFGADGRTTFPTHTVPASSHGAAGDKAGMLALDSVGMYYCTSDFVGTNTQYSVTISSSSISPPWLSFAKSSYPKALADFAVDAGTGWTMTYDGNTYNITSIENYSDSEWRVFWAESITVSNGDPAVITRLNAHIWVKQEWSSLGGWPT